VAVSCCCCCYCRVLAKRPGFWIKVAQRQDPYSPVDAQSSQAQRDGAANVATRWRQGRSLTRRVRRVRRRTAPPPCEHGEQRAAPFALLLLPRVTCAVGFQNSLTLFFCCFCIYLFLLPSHSHYRLPCAASSEIVREIFVAWRGRPITSSYEDSTVPVANQFRLRREESPHGRFCAFFPLAIPTEPFMSHCQMLRIPHHLHILSAWKIILVSLSGKRAFPLRNHTSNDACSARNFSIIAHIGAHCLSLVPGAVFS
jgi:hypothetical protein